MGVMSKTSAEIPIPMQISKAPVLTIPGTLA